MPRRGDRRIPWVARRRRWIQALFFLLFIGLLAATVWPLGRVFLGAFLVADPLIAANTLLNGVWKWEMLLALGVLVGTLALGRVFCGYACPLGFVVELTGGSCGRTRPAWRPVAPLVLVGVAGILLFGSGLALLLDPLALLTRSATTLLFPLVDSGVRLTGNVLYLAEPLQSVADGMQALLVGRLTFAEPLSFRLQALTLAVFVGVLALSFWSARFWCRYLCPLGALLGQVGRFSLFSRTVDGEACTDCGACTRVCPMDAIRDGNRATDPTRCELGLECAAACPTGAISVGYRARARSHVHDPSRRAVLGVGAVSLATGFFLYTGLGRLVPDDFLVRPPGAGPEADFLALCSRCGQCMKVCPTNVLQPAVVDAGWEGVYTPQMAFRHGFCDYSCAECGRVCPTGAIGPLDLAEKRETVVGVARIDRDRCIPWARGETCLVCEELCPVPTKAIELEEEGAGTPVARRSSAVAEARDSEGPREAAGAEGTGGEAGVRVPVVVEDRCIGCGICEYNCPVDGEAAIRVASSSLEDRRR